MYVVTTNNDLISPKGLKLQINSSVGFETFGRMPDLQNEFAQGRNSNGSLIWNGPHTNEVMSWGPMIKTLEYSGTDYAYDRQGMLVPAGTGNGTQARTFDPFMFYKTGFNLGNEITAYFPGVLGSTTSLDWTRKSHSGIVPNSSSTINNFSMNMKKINLSQYLKADVSASYSHSTGRLVNRGANLTSIMGSVLVSPSTFDNAYGYGNHQAIKNRNTYRLNDGQVRSSAPGFIDNPYGLINELPDYEKATRLNSAMGIQYDNNKFQMGLSGNYESQSSQIVNGIFPGLAGFPDGRKLVRSENMQAIGATMNSKFKFENNSFRELSTSFSYQFRNETHHLNRQDGFGMKDEKYPDVAHADSSRMTNISLTRYVHELLAQLNLERDAFTIQIANRSYFSNTSNQNDFVNFFPSASIKVNLDDFLYLNPFYELKVFTSLARTIRESPLFFGNSSVLSVPLMANQYNRYFEDREITWNKNLLPETETKFEAGLLTSVHPGFQIEFNYYNNSTKGLILPVWNGKDLTLQNGATINNHGVNASISYSNQGYNKLRWGASLKLTKYNNKVTSVDLPMDLIPIAGFQDVQTVIKEGDPIGSIYGTTYRRDEMGRKIIGQDGFPLVDNQLKKIGSPIPAFTLSLSPYLEVKRFRVAFILDFKKGGQVWNGTRAALDYYGRSLETAEKRNISNFVFDGVTEGGVINTVPVSFYNPAQPLEQNLWVRNGFVGVGEEYVEDASWIRLIELSLSYKFFPAIGTRNREISISFTTKNIFLITPYSGVDPGTSLFGYTTGVGLDLFNMPSLRSYHFQITFKI
jgi:hypothetical protein